MSTKTYEIKSLEMIAEELCLCYATDLCIRIVKSFIRKKLQLLKQRATDIS